MLTVPEKALPKLINILIREHGIREPFACTDIERSFKRMFNPWKSGYETLVEAIHTRYGIEDLEFSIAREDPTDVLDKYHLFAWMDPQEIQSIPEFGAEDAYSQRVVYYIYGDTERNRSRYVIAGAIAREAASLFMHMQRSPHLWNGAAVDIVAMLYGFGDVILKAKEALEAEIKDREKILKDARKVHQLHWWQLQISDLNIGVLTIEETQFALSIIKERYEYNEPLFKR